MSDDIEQKPAVEQTPAAPNDELKNFKAETYRKLTNLETTNAQLLAQLQAMNKPQQTKPTEASKPVSVFDDEEAYAETVISKAEQRIEKKMAAQAQAQAANQAVIGGLMNEYPELGDATNELTKKANEIFTAMSEDDKSHRLAIDSSVRRAAAELGVKPKSKRSESENDAFSLGGGTGNSRARSRDSDAVDPKTLEFAKMMGVDVEKVKARVKTRKQYGTWE